MQHQLQSSRSRESVEMSRMQLNPNSESTRVSVTDIDEPSGKHELLGVGINIAPVETISFTVEEFHSAIDFRLRLMRDMILSMTGKQIPSLERKIEKVQELSVDSLQPLALTPIDITNITPTNEAPANSFVRVDLDLYEEYERTEVNIGGQLDFDDGTTLDISLNVEMERHYKEEALEVFKKRKGTHRSTCFKFWWRISTFKCTANFI